MTSQDLLRKLNDRPFKPFRIRMVNNTVFDITEPWMIAPGDSSAITFMNPPYREDKGHQIVHDWKTVSIHHMLEFSDLPKRNGSGKRGQVRCARCRTCETRHLKQSWDLRCCHSCRSIACARNVRRAPFD